MEGPQNHIDPKAIRVWRIEGMIITAISAAVGVLLSILSWKNVMPHLIPLIFWLLTIAEGVVIVGLIPNLRWKWCRYEVREEEIDVQKGWLVVKRTIIPMVRVQHVDTSHGPLLRKFDLASVHISTAATVHEIPALPRAKAAALRDHIASLAKVRDDDV